jgi:hypothetical protein
VPQERTFKGNLFQTAGAAELKALLPHFVFVLGRDKSCPLLERRVRLGVFLQRRLERYEGCPVERALYVKMPILNSILKEMGSQCSDRRRGRLGAKRPDFVTTLARQF